MDIVDFQVTVAPYKKTIVTATTDLIPGDYVRLGLLAEPQNTAFTLSLSLKMSGVDIYFDPFNISDVIVPQIYISPEEEPALGAREVNHSYHTSLKLFPLGMLESDLTKELIYSKIAPLSSRHTPAAVSVNF